MKSSKFDSRKLIPLVIAAILIPIAASAHKWPSQTLKKKAPSRKTEIFSRAHDVYKAYARTYYYSQIRILDEGAVVWQTGHNANAAGRYVRAEKNLFLTWNDWKTVSFIFVTGQSPLLIDFKRDGFQVSPKGEGISFDIDANGKEDFIQWVAKGTNDGFLVRDLNGNGYIDDGSELFGTGTEFILDATVPKRRAKNGYEALAQFDSNELGGNQDNKINFRDSIWSALMIWVDHNGNGVSDGNELQPINKTSIASLSLKVENQYDIDASGNVIPYSSWVHTKDRKGPKRIEMVDIFFQPI